MGTKEFNKLIRQQLYPVLREIGFEQIGNRKSFIWKKDVLYQFQIKAVGNYFRDVTGWPSGSFSCSVNPFYGFLNDSCDKDDTGKLIPPKRWPSEGGLCLSVAIDQSRYTAGLTNPAERDRSDLWWLEDDGSNAHEVVEGVVHQVKKEVPDYLMNDLDVTYEDRRDFFPPDEKEMMAYIKGASKEGAIFQLEKMIKFSHYLDRINDETVYRNLLEKVRT